VRRLILSVLLAAVMFAGNAAAAPSPVVERALRNAARVHRVPYWQLRSVSYCESRWNPLAVNGGGSGSSGLFQFLPSTYARTPYGRHSIFSAWWNALAAAWLVRRDGGWSEWTCRP
jgi:soluble lytic murein transglycosylase-like protein